MYVCTQFRNIQIQSSKQKIQQTKFNVKIIKQQFVKQQLYRRVGFEKSKINKSVTSRRYLRYTYILKMHKSNIPLRPIVNCIQSPTYNLSKFFLLFSLFFFLICGECNWSGFQAVLLVGLSLQFSLFKYCAYKRVFCRSYRSADLTPSAIEPVSCINDVYLNTFM